MMKLTTRRETCPTCTQPIIPPTPSKVVLVRVAMAAFAVGSGLLEYRRAVRRELEQQRLEQLHDTSPDVPLDEHLDREPSPAAGDDRGVLRSIELFENGEPVTEFSQGIPAGSVVEPTPWPPSHPSLVDEHDASKAAE